MTADAPAGQRTPPFDEQAERSVLGSMLLSRRALVEVLALVSAEDFWVPRHELVFAAAAALADRGDPVDLVTVSDELTRTGQLERAGGVGLLSEVTSEVPTAANAGWYAEIVRAKAVKRRLIDVGARITQLGFADDEDPAAAIEAARAAVDAAGRERLVEFAPIGAKFGDFVEDLSQKPRFVPTPWREVNEYIGGLRPGCLYVVGARPGEGKTMVGVQIAHELAGTGPVAFSSLEMSTEQLLTRLVAFRGKVHLGPMSRHELSDEDWVKVAGVRHEVQHLPLFIDDRSGVTISQITAFARAVRQQHQRCAGVVVDYLQLVPSQERGRPRWEVVGEHSRQMKILARELDCPVVVLSQLNREPVGRVRRAPTIADLRESGAIEQDADVVLLLQRQLEADDRPGDRLNVHVSKNRHGNTGMRSLLWEGQFARVVSQTWFGGWDPVVPD
ncbi:replicative DNA helicase [Agromyces larvae]|uniref:DNA 5'-3' helicase n=1 Tax=Agromyces larvae TaxID=2929802 RepID=A0ABY4C7L1_9MICO|nr:replicative DNA helicase [Agromyces larvae]UOE46091.1 replicative DNA helicase [Agromyces larvae]